MFTSMQNFTTKLNKTGIISSILVESAESTTVFLNKNMNFSTRIKAAGKVIFSLLAIASDQAARKSSTS